MLKTRKKMGLGFTTTKMGLGFTISLDHGHVILICLKLSLLKLLWFYLLFDLLSYNDVSGTNGHVYSNIEWRGSMNVFGTCSSSHKLKIITISSIVEEQLSMLKKMTTLSTIGASTSFPSIGPLQNLELSRRCPQLKE